MRIVTSAEMRELDRAASRSLGIPSIVLMENAARSVCEVLAEYVVRDKDSWMLGVRHLAGLKVLVVSGRGNNGGDGLAVARLLANQGADVEVVLLGRGEELKGDPRVNLEVLKHCRVHVHEAVSARSLKAVFSSRHRWGIIVDAIFGTGFKGRPEGITRQAIELINDSDAFVVAVDIPSGVQADDGKVLGEAVMADVTVTMALPKRGHVLHPGTDFCGELWLGDIGMPINQLQGGDTFLLEPWEVMTLLPFRPSSGHKGTFGTALVVAGSKGYGGAACLAAAAALRIGCGISRVAVPESLLPVVEAQVLEVVKHGLPQTPEGTIGVDAFPTVRELMAQADAIAVGPGIGTGPETRDMELMMLHDCHRPIVIDADGCNNLVGRTELLACLAQPAILTPHPGELARLISVPAAKINDDRIETARRTAKDWKAIVVLKGAPTVIAEPDGTCWVNPSGNSGLGSGGTGDVLTGVIVGLLAQGASPSAAARAGVYIHGRAADLAAADQTEYALVASDLLQYLPKALIELSSA
ncbi:MAG: NAD(P)H-hydrate dehydratase [candidate division WOR-3 bacterium]